MFFPSQLRIFQFHKKSLKEGSMEIFYDIIFTSCWYWRLMIGCRKTIGLHVIHNCTYYHQQLIESRRSKSFISYSGCAFQTTHSPRPTFSNGGVSPLKSSLADKLKTRFDYCNGILSRSYIGSITSKLHTNPVPRMLIKVWGLTEACSSKRTLQAKPFDVFRGEFSNSDF